MEENGFRKMRITTGLGKPAVIIKTSHVIIALSNEAFDWLLDRILRQTFRPYEGTALDGQWFPAVI